MTVFRLTTAPSFNRHLTEYIFFVGAYFFLEPYQIARKPHRL